MVLALVRGDHRLNEIKLAQRPRRPRCARRRPRRSRPSSGRPGFIGPVGAEVPVVKDAAITGQRLLCRRQPPRRPPDRGRARPRLRLRGGRHPPVEAGDLSPNGDPIEIETAIEVGNIFKLGTRYSEPLGATYLDADGSERPIVMGSYGIGPARIVAAAVEQGADEKGIVWPRSLAPVVGPPGQPRARRARRPSPRPSRLYEELDAGRPGRRSTTTARRAPGEKLTDAELLGCPLRIVVGKRALAEGEVEAQVRRGRRADHRLAVERRARGARSRSLGGARLRASGVPTKRRLFGIDRSGPRPSQTRAGAPLHPLTIPNLVGYLRLALRSRSSSCSPSTRATAARAAPALIYLCDRRRRLRRRLPRPRDRPVLAHGRAARPGRRPARGALRRRRLLAFRAAAALGAGDPRRARAGDPGAGAGRAAARARHRGQLDRADRASSSSSAGSSGAWSSTGGSSRPVSSSGSRSRSSRRSSTCAPPLGRDPRTPAQA